MFRLTRISNKIHNFNNYRMFSTEGNAKVFFDINIGIIIFKNLLK